MLVDATAARALVVDLLCDHEERRAHLKAAARRAEEIAGVVAPDERELLLCATWLHDVGYAQTVRDTGFHALDGARYLTGLGYPARLVGLVAHHSASWMLAEARGLSAELAEFPREEGPLADALVYADMSAGQCGRRMSLKARLDDIEARHSDDPEPVRAARVARRPLLIQAVERTEQRLGGLRRGRLSA